MKPALVISAADNVATALEPLAAGSTVRIGDLTIRVSDPIPRGHKLALRSIAAGEAVIKYGSPIGIASAAIGPGAHVHTHNVASTRGRGDLASLDPPSLDLPSLDLPSLDLPHPPEIEVPDRSPTPSRDPIRDPLRGRIAEPDA